MSSLATSSPVSASTLAYLIRCPVWRLSWLKEIFSDSEVAGYLPRPRGGMASCPCRARQPRPDEGDECDRTLPHGGTRRSCGALRRLQPHGHCLQLLP